tara:strand:- start:878 stop:1822 length:945 start_codon:yes stop_codon:yes gene_type:complete
MKVLVTGGTGFIGSHMAVSLSEQGYDVTICDNNFRGKVDKFIEGINLIEIDLTDKQQLIKLDTDYDCVYHFAAINGTGNFYKIPDKVLRVNTLCNINILDWCLENNIPKILSTSSSETYCANKEIPIPTPEKIEMTVDDIHNPRFSYSGSKIFGELLFINYNRMSDIDVKIVRPHNIYGARMGFEHVIPQVTKRIFDRENPFTIYGYNQTRSFCYIEDAVNQIKFVMEDNSEDIVFNIGSGKELEIRDLVEKMFSVCDYKPDSLTLEEPPQGSVNRRCPDMSLLKSKGHYIDSVSIDDGLKRTCNWYLNYYENV